MLTPSHPGKSMGDDSTLHRSLVVSIDLNEVLSGTRTPCSTSKVTKPHRREPPVNPDRKIPTTTEQMLRNNLKNQTKVAYNPNLVTQRNLWNKARMSSAEQKGVGFCLTGSKKVPPLPAEIAQHEPNLVSAEGLYRYSTSIPV